MRKRGKLLMATAATGALLVVFVFVLLVLGMAAFEAYAIYMIFQHSWTWLGIYAIITSVNVRAVYYLTRSKK